MARSAQQAEQELAQAQELLATQSSDVHQGNQSLSSVHSDAVELARLVALNFKARRWTGYQGPVRDLVERYVRTGH